MDIGTAEDRYYDRMLNEYLDGCCQSQCLVCGEAKNETEFNANFSVCMDCEMDGQYLAGGELFEDAGASCN